MPIYEYQCRSCGHEFEALQKISDPKLTDCPECKQSSLQKKVSAAAFRLKGGGWYETDFKTGNKKNVAGDSGEKSGKSGDKDAAGSKDSKTSDSKSKEGGSKSSESKGGESKSSSTTKSKDTGSN